MQLLSEVLVYLVAEADGLPAVLPEGNGHSLSEVVQLKATRAHCIQDGGVADDLEGTERE